MARTGNGGRRSTSDSRNSPVLQPEPSDIPPTASDVKKLSEISLRQLNRQIHKDLIYYEAEIKKSEAVIEWALESVQEAKLNYQYEKASLEGARKAWASDRQKRIDIKGQPQNHKIPNETLQGMRNWVNKNAQTVKGGELREKLQVYDDAKSAYEAARNTYETVVRQSVMLLGVMAGVMEDMQEQPYSQSMRKE